MISLGKCRICLTLGWCIDGGICEECERSHLKAACPQCGHTQEILVSHGEYCPICLGAGHMYRLMTRNEMIVSADHNKQDGYIAIAAHRRDIAEQLPEPVRRPSRIEEAE